MSLPPLPAGLRLEPESRSDPLLPRRRDPRPKVRLRTGETVRLDVPSGRPTGAAHDGDTFRLDTGQNARLSGVDAFELNQTGRTPSGASVPLGHQAREALLPYAVPDALVTPTGDSTYGRPVVRLDHNGDAGTALLDAGLGIATPEYLHDDAARRDYMEAERLARLNRRGAWQTQFAPPSSYRHGTPNPWEKAQYSDTPVPGGEAVFWDDPTPTQGLRPEIERGYVAIFQDRNSKPADLLAYARENGFQIAPGTVEAAYAARDKPGARIGGRASYLKPPRVLTDPKDGKVGAFARGVIDPINMLDEFGGLANTVVPTDVRENVWSSDRRFGDILANNIDQWRSILAHDDAEHPCARFGGQLTGGLVMPGASVEGAGFGAARSVLEAGGSRFAAEQAARAATIARFAKVGAAEGALAGAGQGETWQDRAEGAMIGGVAGTVLGAGTGALLPRAVATGRRVIDFTVGKMPAAARRAIRQRRGLDPEEGRFGTIHYNLAAPKRWGKALDRMREDDSGEIPAAIHHPEIGNIDLVWGTDKFGVKHIAEQHPEVLDDLPRLVERLPVKQRPEETGNNRYVLEDATHRAIVAPDYDGDTKRWVVTAYEKKGAAPEGADISPRSPVPDGGSTGAGTMPDVGASLPAGNADQRTALDPLEPSPHDVALADAPNRREAVVGRMVQAVDSGAAELRADRGGESDLRSPDRIDVNDRPAPLLSDATDATRAAQAERIAPTDVLPLPANTVGSMEEAERIAAGRVERVRAPDERKELGRRDLPSARDGTRTLPKRGPLDMVTWLRTKGGLLEQGGELRHAGITNAPRRGMDFAGGENRFGPLISDDGMTHDDAAFAAWEAGFFPDHYERPDVATFLDRLTDTHTGYRRAFRVDDLDEVTRFEAARQERWRVEQAEQEGGPLYHDRSKPVGPDDLDANSPPVEAYEEWGENAPNLAGNLRLDKLDSPQAIKRALVATHDRVGGFDAATRGRITHAETERLAGELGMTADDLLKRRKGQAFNAEEALAARQILARSGTDLVNMAKRVARVEVPGDELEAAFKQAWLRHVAIQEQVSGATAEAGRALQAFRMAADARKVDRVLPSLGDLAGGTARLKDVADKLVDLEKVGVGPGGVNQFAAKALKPRFRDKLVELYYNSLLSGPQTHAVNILSNTLTALGQLPEHAVAATIGAARKALPGQAATDRVLFSELGARSVGLVQGTREGLRQAARTFWTGEPADAVTKVEQQTQRAISGVKGSIIRIPTRGLAAEDELFKAMARRMELAGLSVRQAAGEGLNGDAAKARAAELLANPTDDMLKASFDYGRYLTFQRPLGEAGRHVSAFIESTPALKLIVPFVRTPTNLLKFAIERSPAAPLLKEWRKDYVAGGARRDLALAKVMVGSGIGATIFSMAAAGQVTGGGPVDDSAKRLLAADGWQPYSFKVGNRYYSYARLDPYSTLLGTAADLVDLQSHMTDKERNDSVQLIGAAILHNLANKTWLSGLSTAVEAINDPDRSLESFTSRTAGSIVVPAIVAQASRLADPVLREARGPIDRIRSRVPGLSQSLPARRDVFGQPMVSEGGVGPDIIAPVYTSTDKADRTIKMLLDAGTRIGLPSRKVGQRQLTPAEYSKYQRVAGGLAKPMLDTLVRDPAWRKLPDDDQQDAVDKLMKRARAGARSQLFGGGAAKAKPAAAREASDTPPLPPGLMLNDAPTRRHRKRSLPDLPPGLALSQ